MECPYNVMSQRLYSICLGHCYGWPKGLGLDVVNSKGLVARVNFATIM